MYKITTLVIIVTIAAVTFAITAIGTMVASNEVVYASDSNSSILAHAGGGNATDMLSIFAPQDIQVNVGQNVTWDNPSTVAEPHTVTFVLDNKTTADIVSPFSVPNSTQFMPIPPTANSEPLKVPGKDNVVIAANARSYLPAVIDEQGKVTHLAPNATYSITGNEKYINSGWLLPKGQEQAYPGSSTTFTVTFQKAGTYKYFCGLHPWMMGSVTVK